MLTVFRKKKVFLILICVFSLTVLIIPQTGCTEKKTAVGKQDFCFDTTCSIDIYDMEDMTEDAANKIIDDAFDKCRGYEKLLSRTKKGSDIYKINHASGKWVECSDETVDAVRKGLRYCELSDGRFDITIGRITDLWDFHYIDNEPPKDSDIKEAVKTVGYEQVEISGNRIRCRRKDAWIDLGGIAKGYIADRITEYLEGRGVTSAIVNFGGNIECIGDKYGDAFRIGIEKPYSEQSEIVGSVQIKDGGTVVTSGIYERYIEVEDENGNVVNSYHHILDPATGYSADTDIAGVSIRSAEGKSCDCDGLSTVCLLLGIEEGRALIKKMEGVEACFIDLDGNISETTGFDLTPAS